MKGKKNILILGFGFFALLFGAGNLLFPPILGITGGKFWWLALLGFILSDVLFAFLTLFVFSRYASLSAFGEKLGNRFMSIYCTVVILIFALFVFPRTASMTYEVSIQPFVSSSFNSWIFYAIYFGAALLLTLKPSRIFDTLGVIFAPILAITILVIVFFGIINLPTHYVPVKDVANTFRFGFTSGYQTADTLGSLFQASLAAAILHSKGYTDPKDRGYMLWRAGIISMVMFIILYLGLAYVGAKIGMDIGVHASPTQALSYISTVAIGQYGTMFLGFTVLVACFTTGMGLLGIIAHFVSDQLFPKISYRKWAVIFTILGALVAHKGVSFIILVASPVLLIVYPFMICFISLEIFGVKDKFVLRFVCFVVLVFSIIDALSSLKIQWALTISHLIPLGDFGFIWIVPAILAFIVAKLLVSLKFRTVDKIV